MSGLARAGRVLVALVLVGAAGGAVWLATTGPSGPQDCRAVDPDIPVNRAHNVPANESVANVTVERVGPEAIRFTYHDLDGASADYGPSLPAWLQEMGVRVDSASGFAVYRSANGTRLVHKQSADRPQVTVVTEPTTGGPSIDSAGAAITPEWAFVPLPPHTAPTNVSLAPGQPGVVGDQVLLLGPHRTVRREVGCQDIVVHVPTAVDAALDPAAVADSLAAASRSLDVGWRYETVRVFGVGDPIRPGGRAFTHEVWVHAGSPVALPSRSLRYPPRPVSANTWLHEYLHTRQRWRQNGAIADNASWLTEAIPTYYEVAESVRQGRLSTCTAVAHWRRVNASLHRGPKTMNLTQPRTYRQREGDYTRGAYVLAALDWQIQTRTGGLRSLADVWRRLNDRRNVTAADVEAAVVATAGPGIRPWLDRYVSGTAIPPPPTVPLRCPRGSTGLGPIQFGVLAILAGVVAVFLGRLLGKTLVGD